MTRSYRKNIRRTFKHTKSRFIAIFSIIALGVGFLAGLNATPVDMKESMEAYMDDANFYDIRIVSTLGLTDDDISATAAIDGVKDVQPAYNADLLVQTGDDTVVARAHSLPITTGKEETEKAHPPCRQTATPQRMRRIPSTSFSSLTVICRKNRASVSWKLGLTIWRPLIRSVPNW